MQLNKKRGMCSQDTALNLIHLFTVNPSYLVIIEKNTHYHVAQQK